MKGKSFLSVDQIVSVQELEALFDLTSKVKIISQRKKSSRILAGAVLANLFFEPSTRTRISFGAAFNLLGGSVRETSGIASSSLVKGESLYDTGRIISGYVDIMVVRHPEQDSIAHFARSSIVPIINGGNGTGEHPTQALLDVYTIKEEYNDHIINKQFCICLIGDLKNGRTVHSLAKLLSLFGNIHFILVSPPELSMPVSIVNLLRERHNQVLETEDLISAAALADVLYITRIQEERFQSREEFLQHTGKYAVDKHFYATYCTKHPSIMHPLPRNSLLPKPELNDDLNYHEQLRIFTQSDNGIPIRMALFCLILGIEDKVFETLEEVRWYYPLTS